jgi:hypothetical protein
MAQLGSAAFPLKRPLIGVKQPPRTSDAKVGAHFDHRQIDETIVVHEAPNHGKGECGRDATCAIGDLATGIRCACYSCGRSWLKPPDQSASFPTLRCLVGPRPQQRIFDHRRQRGVGPT